MEPGVPVASDGELAQAIARGDHAAETVLYERFASRVLFLARRELHSRELAEDARSETFLRTLTSLRQGRLRTPDSLASFVLQTTRYVVYEMRRQQRPGHAPLADGEADRLAAPRAAEIDPAIVDAVQDAVRELTPRDRSFLRMCYYDELPKDEIARRLGIDGERVRLVKSRALQRFRRAYKGRE